ncbi:carboxypeptidase-like regulatory domain-containing protein [Patescibacteria group bacterium]
MNKKLTQMKSDTSIGEENCHAKDSHLIVRFALIDTVAAAVLLLVITGALFLVRNQPAPEVSTVAETNGTTAQIGKPIDPRDPPGTGVILQGKIDTALLLERVNGAPLNQHNYPHTVEVGDLVQYRLDYRAFGITLEAPVEIASAYNPGYLRFVGMYGDHIGPDQPITQGILHWPDATSGADIPMFEVRVMKPMFRVIKAGTNPNTDISFQATADATDGETYIDNIKYSPLTVINIPPAPSVTVDSSSLLTSTSVEIQDLSRYRIAVKNTGAIKLEAPVVLHVAYNPKIFKYVGTEGALSASSDQDGTIIFNDITSGKGLAAGTGAYIGLRLVAKTPGASPSTDVHVYTSARDARNRLATDRMTLAGITVVAPPPPPAPEPEPEPELTLAQQLQAFFTLSPEQEGVVKTVVAPSTAVINAINLAAAANPLNIGYLFLLLFTEPLQLLFRRRRGSYGVIYNALTKHPLSLVMIRLVEAKSGRVVKTAVSDTKGRFSMTGPPGQYRIQISKAGFVFPSQSVPGTRDSGFANVYHGNTFELTEENPNIVASIPLDPPKAERTRQALMRSRVYNVIRNVIAWVGMAVAVILVILAPSPLTIGLLVAHVIFFFLFRFFARMQAPPTWGAVYDFLTGKPIRGAVVRIYDTQYERLLDSRVTNRRGQYGFIVGQNEYLLDAAKEGYKFPAPEKKKPHDYLGGKFTPRRGSVRMNIPISPSKGK